VTRLVTLRRRVARADDADTLAKAGADLVVSSLDDVEVESLIDGVLTKSRVGSST
jgi:hypothetical protein